MDPTTPNQPAWDGLIQSFLDDDLSAEGQQEFERLLADERFRVLLAEYAIDHTQIYDLGQQRMLDEPMSTAARPSPAGRRRRHPARWAAAAALLIAAVGVFFLTRDGGQPNGDSAAPPDVVIGRLTRVVGNIVLEQGEKTLQVSQEAELASGATVHVAGLAGLARVTLDDGTEISLAGETRLNCARRDGQTTLDMQRGQLSANVARQPSGRPLLIHTPNARIEVLGTRLAVSNEGDVSELGVHHGRVRLKRLSDGRTIEVGDGQYAVASRRLALKARPWPATPDTWQEDFEDGLPPRWRFGQWIDDGLPEGSRGGVRTSRRYAIEDVDTDQYRITLPKQWTRGLWKIHEDSRLVFTCKMSRPGWFQIMMGVRSDDLSPSYVGNYELQSSYWPKAAPDEWRTLSVPFSAFRRNVRGVEYSDLPPVPPRPDDIVSLLWFSTGDVDRGLVIDRIWIERKHPSTEDSQ